MYIILNFKTYPEASGEAALNLAGIVAQTVVPENVDLIICPQATDIFRIREQFPEVAIWAQHVDPIDAGKNTGWTSAVSLIMAGANGTLVNHSEHPLEESDTLKVIEITERYQLTSCLCVPNLTAAQALMQYEPDMFAFEPPELISSGVSLVDTDPQSAQEFVTAMRPTGAKLILGAGVSDPQDLKTAKDLGFDGVLLASAFVKSSDPAKLLADLIAAFAS